MRFWLGISAVLLVTLSISLSGCLEAADTITPEETLSRHLSQVDQVLLDKDLKTIDDSLASWGITPEIEPHGVRYTIQTLGTGEKPSLSSKLTVNYVGKLLDNASIDTQLDFKAILYNLITGWQTTLPFIPEGSKVTLYVPSSYAYGAKVINDNAGAVLVPANSILIFEIELLDVR